LFKILQLLVSIHTLWGDISEEIVLFLWFHSRSRLKFWLLLLLDLVKIRIRRVALRWPLIILVILVPHHGHIRVLVHHSSWWSSHHHLTRIHHHHLWRSHSHDHHGVLCIGIKLLISLLRSTLSTALLLPLLDSLIVFVFFIFLPPDFFLYLFSWYGVYGI